MNPFTLPTSALRRSQLYRRHTEMGADFVTLGDSVVVSHYDSMGHEKIQSQQLGLADLSTLPRIGFKGAGTPDWALSLGIELPAEPNRALVQADGTLVARLSQHELLLASSLDSLSQYIADATARVTEASLAKSVYSLPRSDSHSWLILCGSQAPATLAKVCGVDLRPHKFANGDIAQTSIAKINGVIVRHDQGERLSYSIFSDSSSVEFLWDSLLDAMAEFNGTAIGIKALGE